MLDDTLVLPDARQEPRLDNRKDRFTGLGKSVGNMLLQPRGIRKATTSQDIRKRLLHCQTGLAVGALDEALPVRDADDLGNGFRANLRGQVFENIAADDVVECAIGKRNVLDAALNDFEILCLGLHRYDFQALDAGLQVAGDPLRTAADLEHGAAFQLGPEQVEQISVPRIPVEHLCPQTALYPNRIILLRHPAGGRRHRHGSGLQRYCHRKPFPVDVRAATGVPSGTRRRLRPVHGGAHAARAL